MNIYDYFDYFTRDLTRDDVLQLSLALAESGKDPALAPPCHLISK
jgi:hypothetical protein